MSEVIKTNQDLMMKILDQNNSSANTNRQTGTDVANFSLQSPMIQPSTVFHSSPLLQSKLNPSFNNIPTPTNSTLNLAKSFEMMNSNALKQSLHSTDTGNVNLQTNTSNQSIPQMYTAMGSPMDIIQQDNLMQYHNMYKETVRDKMILQYMELTEHVLNKNQPTLQEFSKKKAEEQAETPSKNNIQENLTSPEILEKSGSAKNNTTKYSEIIEKSSIGSIKPENTKDKKSKTDKVDLRKSRTLCSFENKTMESQKTIDKAKKKSSTKIINDTKKEALKKNVDKKDAKTAKDTESMDYTFTMSNTLPESAIKTNRFDQTNPKDNSDFLQEINETKNDLTNLEYSEIINEPKKEVKELNSNADNFLAQLRSMMTDKPTKKKDDEIFKEEPKVSLFTKKSNKQSIVVVDKNESSTSESQILNTESSLQESVLVTSTNEVLNQNSHEIRSKSLSSNNMDDHDYNKSNQENFKKQDRGGLKTEPDRYKNN